MYGSMLYIHTSLLVQSVVNWWPIQWPGQYLNQHFDECMWAGKEVISSVRINMLHNIVYEVSKVCIVHV